MSKALDYLQKIRSEAMESYFAFYRDAGKRLDPRMRAVISLITKVDNQTERGFRQYLRRALADGVTAGEVIDSLLYAMPTLGLSKIIWAIDIIMDMQLTEFDPDSITGQPGWKFVTSIDSLREGTGYYKFGDNALFIVRQGEDITVFSNICPHQSTVLDESHLAGNILTCPRHKWVFDLQKKECVVNGNKIPRQYDVKIEKNELYILVQ